MPPQLQSVFWDIDLKQFKPQKHPRFAIERVLEYGDLPELKWLESQFTRRQIYRYGKSSRILSPKSRSFLKVRYGSAS
jgi:hypothetical protein